MAYRWHSINIVPHLNAVTIVGNDAPYPVVGRMYEFVWFGWIFRHIFQATKPKRAWGTGVHGPLYSRRRKAWYWRKDAETAL